jgi:hypothetical protein
MHKASRKLRQIEESMMVEVGLVIFHRNVAFKKGELMRFKLVDSFPRITVSFLVLMTSTMVTAQDGTVTPQTIQSTWVGKTLVSTIGNGPLKGKQINLYLNPDGSARVEGAIVDSGTWRLSDQGYCATWKNIRAGQERCFTVVRKGNDQLVNNPDGSLNNTITEIR